MNYTEFENRISDYVLNVLAVRISEYQNKFKIGLALPFILSTIRSKIANSKDLQGFLFDKNGEVNLEIIKASVMNGFKVGGKVDIPFTGITLEEKDAVEFFEFIQKAKPCEKEGV